MLGTNEAAMSWVASGSLLKSSGALLKPSAIQSLDVNSSFRVSFVVEFGSGLKARDSGKSTCGHPAYPAGGEGCARMHV